MKRGILFLLLLVVASQLKAQILKPVKWSYAFKIASGQQATLLLKADIDPGWHIYSTIQPDGGPVKTSFNFNPSKEYTATGDIIEPKPIIKFEKAFDMNVSYFESSVLFQQRVRLKGTKAVIAGKLRFMVCNDKQCLAPETVAFSIPVN